LEPIRDIGNGGDIFFRGAPFYAIRELMAPDDGIAVIPFRREDGIDIDYLYYNFSVLDANFDAQIHVFYLGEGIGLIGFNDDYCQSKPALRAGVEEFDYLVLTITEKGTSEGDILDALYDGVYGGDPLSNFPAIQTTDNNDPYFDLLVRPDYEGQGRSCDYVTPDVDDGYGGGYGGGYGDPYGGGYGDPYGGGYGDPYGGGYE
jgi:hypothetical protein